MHPSFEGTCDGLAGEDIPLGARIIHVADAFDSRLTTRAYRPARPTHQALGELRRRARTQLCARCVAGLEAIVATDDADLADVADVVPVRRASLVD